MSNLIEQIAEKSAIIASNQKKIYDLGFNKGKNSVEPIRFTFDGNEYLAPEGISWGQYVTSSWNMGFSVKDGIIIPPSLNDGTTIQDIVAITSMIITPSDIIRAGSDYWRAVVLDYNTVELNDTLRIEKSIKQDVYFSDALGTKEYSGITIYKSDSYESSDSLYYHNLDGTLTRVYTSGQWDSIAGSQFMKFYPNQLVSHEFLLWLAGNISFSN